MKGNKKYILLNINVDFLLKADLVDGHVYISPVVYM